ncbi:hypothetical protein BC832DRAFT_593529 [Gaertneriomyces semiglobifer]|nr:hypothetical protein BC832DRAFT_593529 [Gaertneriomyces semiglobifer]
MYLITLRLKPQWNTTALFESQPGPEAPGGTFLQMHLAGRMDERTLRERREYLDNRAVSTGSDYDYDPFPDSPRTPNRSATSTSLATATATAANASAAVTATGEVATATAGASPTSAPPARPDPPASERTRPGTKDECGCPFMPENEHCDQLRGSMNEWSKCMREAAEKWFSCGGCRVPVGRRMLQRREECQEPSVGATFGGIAGCFVTIAVVSTISTFIHKSDLRASRDETRAALAHMNDLDNAHGIVWKYGELKKTVITYQKGSGRVVGKDTTVYPQQQQYAYPAYSTPDRTYVPVSTYHGSAGPYPPSSAGEYQMSYAASGVYQVYPAPHIPTSPSQSYAVPVAPTPASPGPNSEAPSQEVKASPPPYSGP